MESGETHEFSKGDKKKINATVGPRGLEVGRVSISFAGAK